MTARTPESRRMASLLAERTVSGALMMAILSGALVLGLIGFAFHTFWVVAIVLLALGLGYRAASARRDRAG